MVLGEVNDGWKVAMATLGFERGTAFLGQQLGFQRELTSSSRSRATTASAEEDSIRQRLAQAYIGVEIMKYNGLPHAHRPGRKGVLGPEASIGKLFWSTWHRDLGELAMDVLGPSAGIIEGDAGQGLRDQRAPADVHVQPVGDDLRRRQRDSTQHHRRAGARAPARAQVTRTPQEEQQ